MNHMCFVLELVVDIHNSSIKTIICETSYPYNVTENDGLCVQGGTFSTFASQDRGVHPSSSAGVWYVGV